MTLNNFNSLKFSGFRPVFSVVLCVCILGSTASSLGLAAHLGFPSLQASINVELTHNHRDSFFILLRSLQGR